MLLVFFSSPQTGQLTALQSSVATGGSSSSNNSGAVWSHTDPLKCGTFTPTTYPARVYVEAGGGGGGGGKGTGTDGTQGTATMVTLLPAITVLMTADGGNRGRAGSVTSAGQVSRKQISLHSFLSRLHEANPEANRVSPLPLVKIINK
jgi:hypothetical protein